MKKIVLCGINASFSHSNLALLCLKYSSGVEVKLSEFSINDSVQSVVRELALEKPDALGFSCYIWNIEYVLKAASAVKKILPHCFIILGGPEVSYGSPELMEKYSFIDMTIRGYGEIPFAYFCKAFESGFGLENTPSACIRMTEGMITTPDTPPYDMNETPFMYGDIEYFRNKKIYYETSRGCPFNCAYCMSANSGVSYLPVERVRNELEYFLKENVMQVKFVDRTFNYPPDRAFYIIGAIIDLSRKYPEARTNFHLEITASLLDEKILTLLKEARKGLIQVEIGIQSTNPETLRTVNRSVNMEKLLSNTEKLCRMNNIHVHADLIAGLPLETYESFKKSFNDAFSLRPEALQLGFLKVLKGSKMRDMADKYKIAFTDYAPYEVLSTGSMSYEELVKLHKIENVLNVLYNSGLCITTINNTIFNFISPFDFFGSFSKYLDSVGYFRSPKKTVQLFEELYKFLTGEGCDADIVKESLTLDWLRMEKPRKWPCPLEPVYTKSEESQARSFFDDPENIAKYIPEYSGLSPKEISKRCYIFISQNLFPGKIVLFDYGKNPTPILSTIE